MFSCSIQFTFTHRRILLIKKMKCSVILFVAVFILFVAADEKYTTKYDNIDLDEILNNQRLYIQYFNCLRNKGKCTPDGKDLKETVPDALATACSKCSEKQKVGTEKVLRFVLEKKPEDFTELEKLYDPEGVYRKKYKEEAEKRGIEI